MLKIAATAIFDQTLATFIVVFTALLISITKSSIKKKFM